MIYGASEHLKVREKFEALSRVLDERSLRVWCATEAKALGRGGSALIHRATGISWPTITKGISELEDATPLERGKIRRQGGGRKKLVEKDTTILKDLDSLIEPVTRGDPENPLRWSSKSTIKLARELCEMGHSITQQTVHRFLTAQKYSMKSNRKTHEGAKENPDRDTQFNFINEKTKEFQARKSAVLSIDTKKKENIGNFKNNGKEWDRKAQHTDVNV